MDALQNMQNMRDNEKISRKTHSVLAKRHNEAAEVCDSAYMTLSLVDI